MYKPYTIAWINSIFGLYSSIPIFRTSAVSPSNTPKRTNQPTILVHPLVLHTYYNAAISYMPVYGSFCDPFVGWSVSVWNNLRGIRQRRNGIVMSSRWFESFSREEQRYWISDFGLGLGGQLVYNGCGLPVFEVSFITIHQFLYQVIHSFACSNSQLLFCLLLFTTQLTSFR